MTDTEEAVYLQLFPTSHIPIILLSIVQAAGTLRKKTHRDKEDGITRRLHARLIRIPQFRDGPLDVRLQPEIPSPDPDADTPAGRIDLLVSCGLGHEVYFAIEAKRLRVCGPDRRVTFYGAGEYVTDGMMRFVSGQYAPYMRAGAMLGYVFDGKLGKARSSVEGSLKRNAVKLKLVPLHQLVPSSLLPNTGVAETHHALMKRRFTIYHLFITV